MTKVDLTTTLTQEDLKSALLKVAADDIGGLLQARLSYGDSCLKRGGVGFMMNLFRKTDRLELLADKPARGERFDLFDIIQSDVQADVDGMLDTVRDLRRYLLLAEAHLEARLAVLPESRDNKLAKGGENDFELMELRVTIHPAPDRTGQERKPIANLPTGFDRTGQKHPFGFDETVDVRQSQPVDRPSPMLDDDLLNAR